LTDLLGSDPFVEVDVADDAVFVEVDVAEDTFTLLVGRLSPYSESSDESDSDESSYESDPEEFFDL
jgi:hypothetical protein